MLQRKNKALRDERPREVHNCLEIQVERDRDNKRIKSHQGKYLTNLSARYGMQDIRPGPTPI